MTRARTAARVTERANRKREARAERTIRALAVAGLSAQQIVGLVDGPAPSARGNYK